jgi:hypothetical protein
MFYALNIKKSIYQLFTPDPGVPDGQSQNDPQRRYFAELELTSTTSITPYLKFQH